MFKNYIYQKFKEICLLIAGGIISLSALPFTQQLTQDWKGILLICGFLILIGIGLLDGLIVIYKILIRFINNQWKKVAIFSPFDLNGNNSSWISVSIEDISKHLKIQKIKASFFKNITDINKYPIVVNPYGGLYPEEDLANLTTIEKIFMYVRNGGIFINLADIPFYYAYDANLKRRVDTTPLVNGLSSLRSFADSLLAKKLHVSVIGVDPPPYKNVARVISLAGNSINFYPHVIMHNKQAYSPTLAIPFGKGYFLFSTLPIGGVKQISKLINHAKSLTR